MQDLDRTTYFAGHTEPIKGSLVTIFDGNKAPQTIQLSQYGKKVITFGRDSKNDIVLTSHLVSGDHWPFCLSGQRMDNRGQSSVPE